VPDQPIGMFERMQGNSPHVRKPKVRERSFTGSPSGGGRLRTDPQLARSLRPECAVQVALEANSLGGNGYFVIQPGLLRRESPTRRGTNEIVFVPSAA
jgi:hypothetical protein